MLQADCRFIASTDADLTWAVKGGVPRAPLLPARGDQDPPLLKEHPGDVPSCTPLEDVEKLVISDTLRHTGGNKAQAASPPGIAALTNCRKQPPEPGEIE
jgi:Bacterial regulatory protein, Fis family